MATGEASATPEQNSIYFKELNKSTARLEQMPELLGILVSMDSKIGFVTFMFKYSHQSNFNQEPFFRFCKVRVQVINRNGILV